MPTTLPHRPELTELLDAARPDATTLRANLRDIRAINRWLGWTAAMTREVAATTRRLGLRDFSLLDVGTGSADIPLALVGWANRRGLALRVLAGDLRPAVLVAARAEVARQHAQGRVGLLCFDAMRAPFPDGGIDVVTCSLTLHHFAPDEAVAALRELGRVAGRALIVSDLERSRLGYLCARLLALVLRNPMTHHDAPVSVLRAYTRGELAALAHAAGLPGARVVGRFPFRLVLSWSPPARAS